MKIFSRLKSCSIYIAIMFNKKVFLICWSTESVIKFYTGKYLSIVTYNFESSPPHANYNFFSQNVRYLSTVSRFTTWLFHRCNMECPCTKSLVFSTTVAKKKMQDVSESNRSNATINGIKSIPCIFSFLFCKIIETNCSYRLKLSHIIV